MFKLIGFCINTELNRIDFEIHKNYKIHSIKNRNYEFHFWGEGDIKNESSNDLTLSYSGNQNLCDRNIIIKLSNNEIVIKNDWLGSIPIFYNHDKKIISTNCNLCNTEKLIDDLGLISYLRCGYSFYTRTPFKDIKFLEAFSEIRFDGSSISITNKEIDFEKDLKPSTPREAFSEINSYLTEKYNKNTEYILPLSGGFDSRLLGKFYSKNKNVKAFSYGIGNRNKLRSKELVFSEYVAKKLKIQWKEIKLGSFWDYEKDWFNIFGYSVHIHGMYHIEFYKKIHELNNFQNGTVVSGIVGDIWAKNHMINMANFDTKLITFTHGINFEDRHNSTEVKKLNNLNEKFYYENYQLINNENLHPILIVRSKIILLNYLLAVPEWLGFKTVTPFLDYKVVMKMLSLNLDEKKDRKWQRDYYKDIKLYPESEGLKFTDKNSLDVLAVSGRRLEHINANKISKYKISNFTILRINIILRLISNKYINYFIRNIIYFSYPLIKISNSYLNYYNIIKALYTTEIKDT